MKAAAFVIALLAAFLMASCQVDCPICGGSGICAPCEGTGYLKRTFSQSGTNPADACTTCGATGKCQTCDGTGKYSNL
jgi:hypothetical protein